VRPIGQRLIHRKHGGAVFNYKVPMWKFSRIGVLTALLIGVSPSVNEPFGLATVASPDGQLTLLWQWLDPAIRADEATIAVCRKDPACGSSAALRLAAIVDEARQYEGRARVGHLNRAINELIPVTHRDVRWMAPLAAMELPGDCKSYAVVKYAALGDAGFAPADRRLVMIWNRAHPQENHLIVVVRLGLQWLILDDETLTLVESTGKSSYEPLHTFDETGVRDFAPVIRGAAS
jgi:predicted transglutaminase-like cysteine proteinase